MEPIRLSDVLRATGGEPAGPVDGDPSIPAVTTDSRDVPRGRALRPDPRQPLRRPRLRGAGLPRRGGLHPGRAATRSSRACPPTRSSCKDTTRALGDLARWYRSRFDVPVVGITGSCGKTTVKEMVRLVLGRRRGRQPGVLQQRDRRAAHAAAHGRPRRGPASSRSGRTRRARSPTSTAHRAADGRRADQRRAGPPRGPRHRPGRDGGEGGAPARACRTDGAAIVNADNYYCREVDGARWTATS